MKKIYVIALIVLSLAGCTGVTDSMSQWSGLGKVTQEKSSFDGATIVEMSPNFLYEKGGWMANKIRLGAQWSSKKPGEIALILSYESDTSTPAGGAFANISGLDINIDGEIKSLSVSGATNHSGGDYDSFQRTIHTSSKNVVYVPYALLEKMMQSADCRLRVRTNAGYEDSMFSIDRVSNGAATARLTLREFMTKVESARG